MYNSNYDWSEKSDDWLLGALRSADWEETNLAMEIFQKRYGEGVRNYAQWKIGWHQWIQTEDIVQDTFLSFWQYARGKKIANAVAVLMGIAHNKCVDALKKQERERRIESDIPLAEYTGVGRQEEVDDPIDNIDKEQQIGSLRWIQFTPSLLSDCERVTWMLRDNLGYPPSAISKLLGKKRQTVYSAICAARQQVREYLSSEDHYMHLANAETPLAAHESVGIRSNSSIERFANPFVPQFTPGELSQTGLTVKEFQAEFITTLVLPSLDPINKLSALPPTVNSQPFLLLFTRRADWDSMLRTTKRLALDYFDYLNSPAVAMELLTLLSPSRGNSHLIDRTGWAPEALKILKFVCLEDIKKRVRNEEHNNAITHDIDQLLKLFPVEYWTTAFLNKVDPNFCIGPLREAHFVPDILWSFTMQLYFGKIPDSIILPAPIHMHSPTLTLPGYLILAEV